MSIETHILDVNRKPVASYDQLLSIVPQSAAKAAKLLNADGINISLIPFKSGYAPKSGIGGFSFSPYRLELLLDSEREDLGQIIRSELPAVLGHEMHHCVRAKHNSNPATLGEFITIEGLATHFEIQMNGGVQPSLFKKFPAKVDWRDLLEEALPSLNTKAFSFNDWFLGGNAEQIPKYTGYMIGFLAVSYYKSQAEVSDFDMIDLTCDELLQHL